MNSMKLIRDYIRVCAILCMTYTGALYACEFTKTPEQNLFFQNIWSGNNKDVEAAIQRAPDLIRSVNSFGESGLTWASLAANKEAVRVLLKSGADINYKTCGGATALHKAAVKGDEELIGILIEAGADLKAIDDESTNLVSSAVFHKNAQMAKILASKVKDFGIMADECFCIFQTIADNNVEMLELLLANGANPNIAKMSGETPLFSAAYDREHMIPILLNAGAIKNIVDVAGKSAMDYARNRKNEKAIKALMEQ